jgi:predicted nucleic-acid-binding protein
MIGIDTNVLVRLWTNDDAAQVARITASLAPFESLPASVYVHDVVLVEAVWVLKSGYRCTKDEIVKAVTATLDAAMFAFDDRERLRRALSLYAASGADFSDCLIVTANAAAGCEHTLSLDRAASHLPGVVEP